MTRLIAIALILGPVSASGQVLDADDFRHHVEYFNGMVAEGVVSHVPNPQAWGWMKEKTPFFTCPDADLERIYYYRW